MPADDLMIVATVPGAHQIRHSSGAVRLSRSTFKLGNFGLANAVGWDARQDGYYRSYLPG